MLPLIMINIAEGLLVRVPGYCVEWSTVPLGCMANIATNNYSIDLTVVSAPLLKVLPMVISNTRRLRKLC